MLCPSQTETHKKKTRPTHPLCPATYFSNNNNGKLRLINLPRPGMYTPHHQDLKHPSHFAKHRTIYEKMSLAGSPSQEALCQSAIDSLDPNIRYCAYNLKLKGGQTMDIPSLMEMRNKSGGGVGLDLLAAKVEVVSCSPCPSRKSLTWSYRKSFPKPAMTKPPKSKASHGAKQQFQHATKNLSSLS